ncbi:DEAD/DEAH box helicase [Pontibacter vulgaris]|uniref:DEAD/DEAH box helicase n=1 Tax=Pontibacter vulgaris TaxID=2905679 RepID=UPI001FA810E6|nr:DEAD/DEAH box helicase [Pontibacter vulgaris]
MPFNPFTIDLPVREIIPAVREHLAAQNTLIVNAPPGAGKSTLLPLALLDEAWLEGQKIVMLEPRRLAAKTIAERLAQLASFPFISLSCVNLFQDGTPAIKKHRLQPVLFYCRFV